jgi:uncharacterized membrane protein
MSLHTVLHPLRARPRLFIAVMLGALLWGFLPADLSSATRIIIALDGAGMLFLLLTWIMMVKSGVNHMRLRARLQDEQRTIFVLLTVGAAIFSLTAITVELHGLKDLPADMALLRIVLAGSSLICSWLVTHTLFALHYAHGHYADGKGGLVFPDCDSPDYWDFMYFSFVVGMTCQTSDVQISGRAMRRLCLSQGVLAFFFNTVILALSINIAAGLL